ncbi:MAG: D-glycero-beta-D-manno-heptose-7-phosphate kinase [Myxococcales bacterium]|nr:D-glycero-beta-D-manno-heptose-7-phosphate kinase [Myxococcales bacterium]
MHPLHPLVDRLRGRRVLVVGDLMLDEYLRGEVTRISPEAPVPVLEVRAHESRLGGAANAAANIQALGGATYLVGVVGKDETSATLNKCLAAASITSTCVPDADRPTSKKTRLVAQQQQIVRVDQEKRHPISGAIQDAVKQAIEVRIRDAHAVVISDYAKGVITPAVARHAIATARAAGLPVVVDPKQADFTLYAGATVITPNLHELELAAPTPGPFSVERIVGELLPTLDGAALLVTRSADGMTLFRTGANPFHVAAIAREVFDVTGAGDTVVATLALALAAQLSLEQAIELASVAAAVSVSKRGTSTVSSAELLAALDAE